MQMQPRVPSIHSTGVRNIIITQIDLNADSLKPHDSLSNTSKKLAVRNRLIFKNDCII
jgi:hypothetical protein